MNPNIENHHRHTIRMPDYNYSGNGMYFITICVQKRRHLFGAIAGATLVAAPAGEMIANEWCSLGHRFQNIRARDFVVMPNHFHGVIEICGTPTASGNGALAGNGATTRVAPTGKTVGDIVGAFKSKTTVEYIRGVREHDWPPFDKRLWQRNYYEHIIRNETERSRIIQYIQNNPINWDCDKENRQ
jgi:REP element-mobilizing transposase RayT